MNHDLGAEKHKACKIKLEAILQVLAHNLRRTQLQKISSTRFYKRLVCWSFDGNVSSDATFEDFWNMSAETF